MEGKNYPMIKWFIILFLISIQSEAFPLNGKAPYSISQVVDSIRQKYNTQRGYAQGVYDWVIQNIKYDYAQEADIIRTKKAPSRTPEMIFERRKGTCVDYAVLVRAMFEVLQIECKVIKGCTRLFDTDLISYKIVAPHAWNAVFLEGKWYFMDCTLGRDDIDPNLPFRPYFLLTPEQFSLTHYSFGGKESFTESQLEATSFTGFPIVHRYFEFYDQLPDLQGKISSDIETFKFRISQSDSLSFKYANIEDLEDRISADIEPDPTNPGVTLVKIPPKGRFLLKIYRLYPIEKGFSRLIPILTYYVERK